MKRLSGAARRRKAKQRKEREAAEANQQEFIKQAMDSSEGRKKGWW